MSDDQAREYLRAALASIAAKAEADGTQRLDEEEKDRAERAAIMHPIRFSLEVIQEECKTMEEIKIKFTDESSLKFEYGRYITMRQVSVALQGDKKRFKVSVNGYGYGQDGEFIFLSAADVVEYMLSKIGECIGEVRASKSRQQSA